MERVLDQITTIQNTILSLNNMDDTNKLILKLHEENVVNNKESLYRLLKMLNIAFTIRPYQYQYYIHILEDAIPQIKQYFKPNEILTNRFNSFWSNDFIFDFMIKNGIYTEDNFVKKIGSIIKNNDENRSNSLGKDFFSSIQNDDINMFQDFFSQSNLSFDMKMEYNIDGYFDKTANVTWKLPQLIEYVAFCGSIKIFKFLWLNKANTKIPDLYYFSIAGGNSEIIHLVESINFDYNIQHLVVAAIEFHRNDVVQYLFNTKNFEILEGININISIEYNNIEILLYILDHPSITSELLATAIFSSILYCNIDILKYLIEAKKVNLNDKAVSKYLIIRAIRTKNTDIVRYLCGFKEIDLNDSDEIY
ncbi:hypothetical protein TRFO_19444 [Tritrichomonas foetus]|uniref:DUF3447 domain-containing protein n=1 Tax=Tritrichomonas foetus TaxID=1144522 RepID=A0A1J4KIJ0_9EUKA|nr:hypothetical protein TRFO_19444 [Tritrichomonas foetus]|eukprot:OHT11043.1 hypothetical protein TRFO_19444 [Tritrichomonas foetus]